MWIGEGDKPESRNREPLPPVLKIVYLCHEMPLTMSVVVIMSTSSEPWLDAPIQPC